MQRTTSLPPRSAAGSRTAVGCVFALGTALALLASACVVEPVERPLVARPAAVRVDTRAGPVASSTYGTLRFIYEQFPGAPGLLVKSVEAGRAADRAGVRKGDCIMAVGGRPIAPDADVGAFFRPFAVGERVGVALVRDGRPLTVDAVLDPPPPVVWRAPALPTPVFTTSPVCMKSER